MIFVLFSVMFILNDLLCVYIQYNFTTFSISTKKKINYLAADFLFLLLERLEVNQLLILLILSSSVICFFLPSLCIVIPAIIVSITDVIIFTIGHINQTQYLNPVSAIAIA